MVRIDRLDQAKYHSTTTQPTSSSQRPSSRNLSRENLEQAQADNPYSKSYSTRQTYNPSNYDSFEGDPVRPSSRVPKNQQTYPNHQVNHGAVTDPNTQQQLERHNMNRASARYRKQWTKPKDKVNPKTEDPLFADLDPLVTQMKNMSTDQKRPVEAEPMEIDYAPASQATSTLYNPSADPPISTQTSDLINMETKADSSGMHNVKKGKSTNHSRRLNSCSPKLIKY